MLEIDIIEIRVCIEIINR